MAASGESAPGLRRLSIDTNTGQVTGRVDWNRARQEYTPPPEPPAAPSPERDPTPNERRQGFTRIYKEQDGLVFGPGKTPIGATRNQWVPMVATTNGQPFNEAQKQLLAETFPGLTFSRDGKAVTLPIENGMMGTNPQQKFEGISSQLKELGAQKQQSAPAVSAPAPAAGRAGAEPVNISGFQNGVNINVNDFLLTNTITQNFSKQNLATLQRAAQDPKQLFDAMAKAVESSGVSRGELAVRIEVNPELAKHLANQAAAVIAARQQQGTLPNVPGVGPSIMGMDTSNVSRVTGAGLQQAATAELSALQGQGVQQAPAAVRDGGEKVRVFDAKEKELIERANELGQRQGLSPRDFVIAMKETAGGMKELQDAMKHRPGDRNVESLKDALVEAYIAGKLETGQIRAGDTADAARVLFKQEFERAIEALKKNDVMRQSGVTFDAETVASIQPRRPITLAAAPAEGQPTLRPDAALINHMRDHAAAMQFEATKPSTEQLIAALAEQRQTVAPAPAAGQPYLRQSHEMRASLEAALAAPAAEMQQQAREQLATELAGRADLTRPKVQKQSDAVSVAVSAALGVNKNDLMTAYQPPRDPLGTPDQGSGLLTQEQLQEKLRRPTAPTVPPQFAGFDGLSAKPAGSSFPTSTYDGKTHQGAIGGGVWTDDKGNTVGNPYLEHLKPKQNGAAVTPANGQSTSVEPINRSQWRNKGEALDVIPADEPPLATNRSNWVPNPAAPATPPIKEYRENVNGVAANVIVAGNTAYTEQAQPQYTNRSDGMTRPENHAAVHQAPSGRHQGIGDDTRAKAQQFLKDQGLSGVVIIGDLDSGIPKNLGGTNLAAGKGGGRGA